VTAGVGAAGLVGSAGGAAGVSCTGGPAGAAGAAWPLAVRLAAAGAFATAPSAACGFAAC
jgi:hypothetical protein